MGATVKATAAALAAFNMRLIMSVERAADEPEPQRQAGGLWPCAACGLHPTACPFRLSENPVIEGTPRNDLRVANCGATYCAPHQCQANNAHSATSCGAFAMSTSMIQRSGSVRRRRST